MKNEVTLTFTKEQLEIMQEALQEFYYMVEDNVKSPRYWEAFRELENKIHSVE